MLSYGVVAIIQTCVIILTTVWLLHIQIVGQIGLVFLINILLAFTALAMGIFVSTFVASQFQMMESIPIVALPQVFFSGLVPLEGMPSWTTAVSKILPLTYASDAMSGVMLKGETISVIAPDLWALVAFIAVFCVLNVVGLRRYRKC